MTNIGDFLFCFPQLKSELESITYIYIKVKLQFNRLEKNRTKDADCQFDQPLTFRIHFTSLIISALAKLLYLTRTFNPALNLNKMPTTNTDHTIFI